MLLPTEINKDIPASIEAEQALLGVLVLNNKEIVGAKEVIKEDHFYQEANRTVYRAILESFRAYGSVDLLTLKETLGEDSIKAIGGIGYLSSIIQRPKQSDSFQSYFAILEEKRQKRLALSIGEEVKRAAIEEEPYERILKILERIKEQRGGQKHPTIVEASRSSLENLETVRKQGVDLEIGLSELDAYIGGVRRKTLYMVGGKTSHGKTTFALNIVRSNLDENPDAKILYAVFENEDQVPTRLASIKHSLPLEWFIKPHCITEDEFIRAKAAVEDIALYGNRLSVVPNPTIDNLRAICRERRPDIVVVDFLQRYAHRHDLSADGRLSHEVGKLVSDLQDLALEYNNATFCLSQFSRRPHEYRTRPPEVEDLKESGDIENYSDVIMLLYWPWRDSLDDSKHNKNDYKILIRKNKLGPCGDVNVKIDVQTLKLSDWGK